MALFLPRFQKDVQIVDKDGKPLLTFHQWWDQFAKNLETQVNALIDVVEAVQAAQDAADAANAAADNANDTAEAITESSALSSSYVSGLTLSATDAGADATINISAHTRHYPQPDGSTVDVAVNGGSLTGQSYSTTYYVYYDDPTRVGGAVTYQSTTSTTTAAQIGDRHFVGGVITPAAAGADTDGDGPRPPGVGAIRELEP